MEQEQFIRICPVCSQEVIHLSRTTRNRSEKEKKPCKNCGFEATRQKCRSPEYRAAHSERITQAWKSEDSIFNSSEYRRKLSDAQLSRDKLSYEKASLSLKESWKKEKENPTGRVEKLIEMFKSDEVRTARSASLKKLYERDPEQRAKRSKIAKELMKDPEHRERCTRKMIDAARKTGGTSKNEKELAQVLAELGFTHKHPVGRWMVDFYHPGTDTVVEFFGDWWHCHERFFQRIENDYGGIHPNKQKTPFKIIEEDNERISNILTYVKKVIVLWQNDVTVSGSIVPDKVKELLAKNGFFD